MSLKQTRLDALEGQLDNANVELDPVEPRLYHVTVPGALREQNHVKADNEHEALDKVRATLIQKIEQAPEHSTGDVVIQPHAVGRG